MNKISKKILAIVTMVAFVVTMMPFAAFAAGETSNKAVAYDMSSFNVIDEDGNVLTEVDADTTTTYTAQFALNDNAGDATTAKLAAQTVKIWAVDNDTNQVTSALNVTAGDGGLTVNNATVNSSYYVVRSDVANEATVNVSFSRGGNYTLYAGVGEIDALTTLSGEAGTVFAVDGPTVEVAGITVEGATEAGYDNILVDGDVDDYTNVPSDFIFNGIDSFTVKGVAYATDKSVAKDQTFTVTSNKDNALKINGKESDTVTTNSKGAFDFDVTIEGKDDYKLYISGDNFEVTLNIKAAEAAELDTIENTTEDAQTLLASNDNKYADQGAENFADAVQFTITKDNGEVATEQSTIATEPAAIDATDRPDDKHDKYVTILDKPSKSKLTASDINLVWSSEKNAYTLEYVAKTPKADLIDGEYTVKVALTSGKSAEATFTLAKFGTVQDLAIDMNVLKQGTVDESIVNTDNLGVQITDEVVLGNKVRGVVKYVDENGIEVNANEKTVQVGINGSAIENGNTENSLPYFGITTKANTTDNENLLGTVITVTAFDTKVGKMKTAELTVVDGKTANTLAFDNEQGEANKTNTVEVSIVDEDGDLVRETGDMYAYIADQSNEDANIEVTPAGTNGVKSGKGDLKIFSDKETSVDVVVAVKVEDAVYAKTLTYTIGEEDINADTTVVMTIGSSDIVVNNEVVTGDAAPFVDSNWRTMVPVRALSQSFGGSAEWDGDARTVTVENGDKTIVFNADSDKYTVNGEEKTMDTELTIVDGRTYVPVKFVAEELGYTVTALKDAQGLTASVVIQK